MWIYSVDDISRRVNIGAVEGFFLDYWVFLHCDETHRLWSCRPIGLSLIASTLNADNLRYIYGLPRILGGEIESLRSIDMLMSSKPPEDDFATDNEMAQSWIEWFRIWEDPQALMGLLDRICLELSRQTSIQDIPYIAFLTRRLASEVSHIYESPRVLLQKALKIFLYQDTEVPLYEKLRDLITPVEEKEHKVMLQVSEVPLSTRLVRANQYLDTTVKYTFRITSEDSDTESKPREGCVLTGFEATVQATHSELAISKALAECRKVLHHLRVRHYIRTHFYGAVLVHVDGQDYHMSLPQPFWNKGSGRRKVPQLPYRFEQLIKAVPAYHKSSYKALRWHVSQAIGHWPEDVHTAASEVWQGLEAYARREQSIENAKAIKEKLVADYLEAVPMQIIRHLAKNFTGQSAVLKRSLGDCDWYYWDSKRYPLEVWLRRVLHIESSNHFSSWRTPPAPLMLFNEDVGLLTSFIRKHQGLKAPVWAFERMIKDLDWLYLLRNAVVHGGIRHGSDRLAAYLGRLGLETAFTSVESELLAYSNSARTDQEGNSSSQADDKGEVSAPVS